MKQSTIDMIDSAMAFNVEVQEDNLNLQEMKHHLLQMSRNLNGYSEKLLDQAIFSIKSYEEYTNPNSLRKQISLELLSMIDSSITDLDKRINYPHFTEVEDQLAVMYNVHTIENIRTSLREMLNSIGKLGSSGITYLAMKNQFIKDNEMNLVLTNTHISEEDYVEMNIPQPKYQSIKDAEVTKDGLNTCSKLLNSIVDQDILQQLGKTKYEVSAKMAIAPDDAIKSAHFIAQVVMAIKNAALLMKNYHDATLNELNNAIVDENKTTDIPYMVKRIKEMQVALKKAYQAMPDAERRAVASEVDIDAAVDWDYNESMSEKEVKRQLDICYRAMSGLHRYQYQKWKESRQKKK